MQRDKNTKEIFSYLVGTFLLQKSPSFNQKMRCPLFVKKWYLSLILFLGSDPIDKKYLDYYESVSQEFNELKCVYENIKKNLGNKLLCNTLVYIFVIILYYKHNSKLPQEFLNKQNCVCNLC